MKHCGGVLLKQRAAQSPLCWLACWKRGWQGSSFLLSKFSHRWKLSLPIPYNAWIKSTWKKIKIECREEKLGEIVAEALSFLCQSCPDQRGGRSSSLCSSSHIIAMTQINAPAHCQWPMLETFAPGTEIAASSDGLARHDVSPPPTAGEEGGGNPCSSRPEAPAPLMAGPHTRFTCCAHCSQSMGYKCLILLLATRIYYKAHKDVWKAFARVLFRARKLESTVDNLYLVMQKSSNADTNADR